MERPLKAVIERHHEQQKQIFVHSSNPEAIDGIVAGEHLQVNDATYGNGAYAHSWNSLFSRKYVRMYSGNFSNNNFVAFRLKPSEVNQGIEVNYNGALEVKFRNPATSKIYIVPVIYASGGNLVISEHDTVSEMAAVIDHAHELDCSLMKLAFESASTRGSLLDVPSHLSKVDAIDECLKKLVQVNAFKPGVNFDLVRSDVISHYKEEMRCQELILSTARNQTLSHNRSTSR